MLFSKTSTDMPADLVPFNQTYLLCLFDLISTSHKQSFSYVGTGLSGLNQFSTKLGKMCLAQGHNAVSPVKLKPAAPLSRVKHSRSTTELLRTLRHTSWSIEHQREKLLDRCFSIRHAILNCETLINKTIATLSMQHTCLLVQ